MSADDPLRRLLRDGGRFDDFCSTVPRLAACLRLSVPTDEPIPFAGIENRRRKLIGSGGPVVGGYVLVGDSAMHTNPTLGRGTSLAFKQAQFVASNLDLAFADPTQFVADYANWQDAQIAHWFDSQVSADREHCERLRALAHGEPLPPLSSEGKIALAMQLLAATDPLIARAGARIFHMLQKPSEVLAGGDVEQKLSEFLACNPDLTEPREGAPRASLLQWP
jgi:flavin-dependent dehydrogenase